MQESDLDFATRVQIESYMQLLEKEISQLTEELVQKELEDLKNPIN